MTKSVDLSRFSNSWYRPGNTIKRALWYAVSALFFKCSMPYPGSIKVFLLRLFGATVGERVTIKPSITIKYPWLFEIGDNCWLGEGVWIDNLGKVTIGKNVCVSQEAYVVTGNHDYKKETFDLIVDGITLEDGSWISAKAIICPGVTVRTHSVITAGSVVTHDTEPYTVYRGNPAQPVRKRIIH